MTENELLLKIIDKIVIIVKKQLPFKKKSTKRYKINAFMLKFLRFVNKNFIYNGYDGIDGKFKNFF